MYDITNVSFSFQGRTGFAIIHLRNFGREEPAASGGTGAYFHNHAGLDKTGRRLGKSVPSHAPDNNHNRLRSVKALEREPPAGGYDILTALIPVFDIPVQDT
ncbi:UNVERIFIED_CONTAM: hypothetical protein PYX00_000976 [Menopon gallinae]|uniref:Uncharacterized protein n=1 Tax=Menopon gallinae TaxID=328185 RepID=A0AAW2IB63_9NEOP